MVSMKKYLFLILAFVLVYGVFQNGVRSGNNPPDGITAPQAPLQTAISSGPKSITVGNYRINPIATFDLTARALSARKYSHDRESDLSPIDIAFGWGPMSDNRNLDHIKITQSNRWYHWRYADSRKLMMSPADIPHHSANMHLIPANKAIKKQLLRVKKNDIVHLQGSLVSIKHADGWRWRSSTSRTDQGHGSCEVIYVESVKIEPPA